MKILYTVLALFSVLLYGCFFEGCFDYGSGPEPLQPKTEKTFTIINHTNKEYNDNNLRGVCAKKSTSDGKWKLYYESRKIKIIKEGTTERDILRIDYGFGCAGAGNLFLLSLNGGKRKIFFGAHGYDVYAETKRNAKTCRHDFAKWNIHPVFQEKELTIHIYEHRIEFSDPKIKETKRLRVSYDEYVDPKTLPLVECCEE